MLGIDASIRRVSVRAKKKHRAFADQAGLYGIDVARIERTDYERYVGLWANRDREFIRNANGVRTGIVTAFSDDIDKGWFAAVCESRDEATAVYDQYQANRVRRQSGATV